MADEAEGGGEADPSPVTRGDEIGEQIVAAERLGDRAPAGERRRVPVGELAVAAADSLAADAETDSPSGRRLQPQRRAAADRAYPIHVVQIPGEIVDIAALAGGISDEAQAQPILDEGQVQHARDIGARIAAPSRRRTHRGRAFGEDGIGPVR